MLEELAIKYLGQPPLLLGLIGVVGLAIGAIPTIALNTGKSELSRAPFFATSALITFVMIAASTIWLLALSAMAGGYLWALVAASLTLIVVSGILHGALSAARARDASGNRWLGLLMFVPFGGLWLLFAPSESPEASSRKPVFPPFSGALGVLAGFVFYAAAVSVFVYLQQEQIRIVERASTNPASQQAGVEFLIRSRGLEDALTQMAETTQTPITIDDVTTLRRIEADGAQLTRTYEIAADLSSLSSLPEDFQNTIETNICGSGPFGSLLDAGATVSEVYVDVSGAKIGTVEITKERCGR